jgi:hypothetical protein
VWCSECQLFRSIRGKNSEVSFLKLKIAMKRLNTNANTIIGRYYLAHMCNYCNTSQNRVSKLNPAEKALKKAKKSINKILSRQAKNE